MPRKKGEGGGGGTSSSELADLASLVIVGAVAYYFITNPSAVQKLGDIFKNFSLPTLPSTSGTSPSSSSSGGGGGGSSKSTASGANNPTTLGYKGTGKKVAMEEGSDRRNGKRYNVNRSYKNYLIIGHYKIGSGQETINCKTDGPNRGSCTSLPKCVWIEPNLTISSGKLDMTAEYPHPKNHNGLPCPSCKNIGAIKTGQWLGWGIAAFDSGGYRKIEVWTDKSGTGAQWTKIASEVDKGQITTSELAKRQLPTGGKGLEAEIRMRGAKSGDTAMRDAWVYEITP